MRLMSSAPAARYHISPRELQVLALLLDGAKLEEIGNQLSITSSTVQDHIKSMVDKTAAGIALNSSRAS